MNQVHKLSRKEFLQSMIGFLGTVYIAQWLESCDSSGKRPKNTIGLLDINRPSQGPFISLIDYTQASQSSTAFTRFKTWVDNALAGSPGYGYSAGDSLIMYHLTSDMKYLTHAITMIEEHVHAAEKAVKNGDRPPITDDSYLEVGPYIEDLSLVFDYGFAHLTSDQRARWAGYAEQAVWNIWNYAEAKWGNQEFPWSGWSTDNPGNNYHFSFLKATMTWGLASQQQHWIDFLNQEILPPLIAYYQNLPGGGSREGTGYGTAQQNLFELYRIWKASTQQDLSAMSPHARNTIDYWIHATVPTLDKFAPFGDQSRSSHPDLFDYQRHLVQESVIASKGTTEARRGVWWLQHISISQMTSGFMRRYDLLKVYDQPEVPTAIFYHAQGVGHLFARSGWTNDASWLAFAAGPYEESHAHQDQGSFMFYKNDWLAVTNNIWSHSGLHQETELHNVIRFTRNGTTIEQTPSSTVQSSMTPALSNGVLTVNANLSNAFSANRSDIISWLRDLTFQGNTLRIHDTFTIHTNVQAIWQMHVPVNPVIQNDGSIVAGNLTIKPILPAKPSIKISPMPSSEYSHGYRIELTASQSEFTVELIAK